MKINKKEIGKQIITIMVTALITMIVMTGVITYKVTKTKIEANQKIDEISNILKQYSDEKAKNAEKVKLLEGQLNKKDQLLVKKDELLNQKMKIIKENEDMIDIAMDTISERIEAEHKLMGELD